LTNRWDFATRVLRWRFWHRQTFVLTQRHNFDSATTVNICFYCLGPTALRLSKYWRISSVLDANVLLKNMSFPKQQWWNKNSLIDTDNIHKISYELSLTVPWNKSASLSCIINVVNLNLMSKYTKLIIVYIVNSWLRHLSK